MKIYMLTCVVGLLGIAVAGAAEVRRTIGQEFESLSSESPATPTRQGRVSTVRGLPDSSSAARPMAARVAYTRDVQTAQGEAIQEGGHLAAAYDAVAPELPQWYQVRNGHLWADYCIEKQMPHAGAAEIIASQPCGHGLKTLIQHPDPCGSRPHPCGSRPHPCGSRPRNRCTGCRRQRILSFEIFCDLLGWRQCDCCVVDCGATCDRRPECSHHARPESVDEPVPARPIPDMDGPQMSKDAQPPSNSHSEPHEQRVQRRGTGADELETGSVESPGSRSAQPEMKRAPVLDPPKIPRNDIPKSKRAVPKSTRRTSPRTLVAERLSDYIDTR